METLPLEGLPRRLFTVSASSLGAWVDCPRRYRMAYVDRPPPPRVGAFAHNSLGASVHNALRDWWLAPRQARTPSGGAAQVDGAWIADGYRDEAHSLSWRARAREWVSRYVGELDPDREPASVERSVWARYGDTQVRGRIDRLDDRDGELVVVDYKTGRRGVSEDEARGSWALAIYAYAVERTVRRPCRRVELHDVRSGHVAAYEHSVDSLRRHLDRITEAAEEARSAVSAVASAGSAGSAAVGSGTGAAEAAEAEAAEVAATAFPARPSQGCGWCEFHRSCPAGQAAVPQAREPWAALDEEVVAM